jgi:RimJ/RimL family protein N-acetyltransferase
MGTDIPSMARIANNEKITRNLRDGFPHPYTDDDAREFIDKCLALDPPAIFAIEYKGEYAGNIGLSPGTNVYRKSAEVGYFIGEEYWNRGIVTKALALITDYGFGQLDLVRIHTGVYEHNLASQRVLEKCGFVKEGVFRKAVYKKGEFLNEVRYAKLKDDEPEKEKL